MPRAAHRNFNGNPYTNKKLGLQYKKLHKSKFGRTKYIRPRSNVDTNTSIGKPENKINNNINTNTSVTENSNNGHNVNSNESIPNFIFILIAVIISWVVIQLWTTAIEAYFYSYLGLSQKSAVVTFLVASIFTLIFVMMAVFPSTIGISIQNTMWGATLLPGNVAQQIISDKYLYPE